MTRNQIIVLVVVIVLIVAAYFFYLSNKEENKTCFDLPRSSDPDVFGSGYWKAFHKLAADVPCGHCRGFAEKFISFFHDIVNVKTGKQLYDPDNYNYFLKSISNLNAGQSFNDAFAMPAPTTTT